MVHPLTRSESNKVETTYNLLNAFCCVGADFTNEEWSVWAAVISQLWRGSEEGGASVLLKPKVVGLAACPHGVVDLDSISPEELAHRMADVRGGHPEPAD